MGFATFRGEAFVMFESVQGVPTWASGNSAAWLGKPSFFSENREDDFQLGMFCWLENKGICTFNNWKFPDF